MNRNHSTMLGSSLGVLLLVSPGHPRAVEAPLSERVARSRVIGLVKGVEILRTNPPGLLRHVARVEVVVPIKGTSRGQFLLIDYDTGLRCPNVLYQKGEECLVFLAEQPSAPAMGLLLVRRNGTNVWGVA